MTNVMIDKSNRLDVTGELLFAMDGGEAPTVIVQKNDEGTVRRGGLDIRPVFIADGTGQAYAFSLDQEGFSFLSQPSAVSDFENDDEVVRSYYPEIKKVIADALGALEVEIFDHTLRVTDPETSFRRPASHAHNDYTAESGPSRLRDMIGDERAADWLKDRVVQVNVWRPIAEPVEQMPLALLDASSLNDGDLIDTKIINERQGGRVGHIYSVRHAEGHRWFYFPNMTKSEAILIKGYDSADDGRARFTPHSAFVDPNTPDSPAPRRSIEVRTFARVPLI